MNVIFLRESSFLGSCVSCPDSGVIEEEVRFIVFGFGNVFLEQQCKIIV